MREKNLQLYSLKQQLEADFKGTLVKVGEMGYTGVEFAGYGDLNADEMKQLLEECNLKAISAHISIDELENNLDFHINYLKTIGCRYIICPYSDIKTREDAIAFANRLNTVANKCLISNMFFGYHNHAHEFVKAENGEYLFDIMMNNCNDLVLTQLDVFWLKYADLNPEEYIKRYGGKVGIMHLKQFDIIDGVKKNVTLNDGIIDIKSIVRIGKQVGTQHFIVEQEFSDIDRLEACKIDANFLKSI